MMKANTTAQRLKQIMSMKDLRQVDVLRIAEPFCKKYGVRLGKNDLSQYLSGKVEPKQDKLTVLGLALGVSEAWLMGFDVPAEREAARQETTRSLSPAAQSLARSYDALDEHGREVIDAVMESEVKRMHPAPVIQLKDIPMIQSSLAAGAPEPDFGMVWETYSVPADTRADFAARINGDSMEPYIKDGSVVLGLRGELRSGDVGAFLLNGEFLCKQYVKDNNGAWLRSLNRDRADTDVVLNGEHSLICFGKVILDRPVPVVEK